MINRLLLDTHAWVWLVTGSPELKPQLVEQIEAAGNLGALFLGAISTWEVATLVSKKRLSLSKSLQQWVDEAMALPGLQLASLTPAISVESTVLPGVFYGDPADRIIVATARVENLALVTRDRAILEYGQQGFLNVVAI